MTDVHSKEIRSYNMSRIRSTETKPERLVRQYLFKNGFRFRKNVKNLLGKPDIVLQKYKTIIFVHGCFWHGHDNCIKFKLPKTKTKWWKNKISRNKTRDTLNCKKLKDIGWNIIIIYECELMKIKMEKTFKRLLSKLIK